MHCIFTYKIHLKHKDILYHRFTDVLKKGKNVVAQCKLYHNDILVNTDVDIYPLPNFFCWFPCTLSWLLNTHPYGVAKASLDVSLCCPPLTYFPVVLALALQKIIGGSSRDHLFGVEVKFVANASLVQMHKSCLERNEVCTSFDEVAFRRLVSQIPELRYLRRRQPRLSEEESRATAAQWALVIFPSCSAARRTFRK